MKTSHNTNAERRYVTRAYHPHDLAVVCPSFLVLVVTKRGDVVVKVDGDSVIVVVMLGRERECG